MKKLAVFAFLCAQAIGATAARADVVTDWNSRASTLISAGHPGPAGMLDFAIVHAAIHDAVQAYEKRYRPYAKDIRSAAGSMSAAVATAARDVLYARLPEPQRTQTDEVYLQYLADQGLELSDPGVAVGSEAAAAVLLLRQNDGSFPAGVPPFVGGTNPGVWRPTPPGHASMIVPWLGAVRPYTMDKLVNFQPAPVPPLNSLDYAEAYNEVKAVGAKFSTSRTAAQSLLARFYNDNFFAQWNRVVRRIADLQLANTGDRARLLALVNLAGADAVICAWESKTHYVFWRPLTAIREAEHDGNPLTDADPTWEPLLTTPPYAEYPSGANSLTAAITHVLALVFGTDHVRFEMSSESPSLLPADPRVLVYERFSDVAKDMVDVRVWQGIHFRFADTEARSQGWRIANHAFKNFLRRVER